MTFFKELTLKLHTDFSKEELREEIQKEIETEDFSYEILKQSLDARKKNNIHWLLQCGVSIGKQDNSGQPRNLLDSLNVVYSKRSKKVTIVGSGPAGFFSAYILQLAGFDTTIIERGANVDDRTEKIQHFHKTGEFDANANYAFGEGGAGTFSDGKLTARSKRISIEKNFILQTYISAGAPPETAYLAHPHLGSDNLIKIVKELRKKYIEAGGEILFNTKMLNFKSEKGRIQSIETDKGEFQTDFLVMATGLSAYETSRMLMNSGVQFRTKGFALGYRVEHRQDIINEAQWGKLEVPGLKAAEYRLTFKEDGALPVYSFCMCPGGTVVPSTPYSNMNIVNGMSYYSRGGKFANAGIVAAIHPDMLLGETATPMEAITCLEMHEKNFFELTDSYAAPFCSIRDFIKRREPTEIPETSYPLGLEPVPLHNILPSVITSSIRKGLQNFSRKIKGFKNGIILGLESKTSSPIQAVRDKACCSEGFDNLFIIGEGSGCAGGIVSSAVDGVRCASAISR